MPTKASPDDLERTVATIIASIDDDKGQDIVDIDLAGKTAIADRMIIASGNSARQVSAMAEHISVKMKAAGRKVRSEGEKTGDWALIDVGDVIVHLFRPEVRAFYNIEKIWDAAKPGKKPAPKRA
ncbi:MAG: ribosome silencing factor [Rhodobacteraceae bacterium]|nr:ribosome silencing factor [Paracoccaceae bacterium]